MPSEREGRGRKKRQNNGQAAPSISLARLAAGHQGHRKASHCRSSRSSLMRIQNPSSLSEGWRHHTANEGQHKGYECGQKATSESGFRDEQENPPARHLPGNSQGSIQGLCAAQHTSGSDLQPLCQLPFLLN